jgi:hypothetical protein
VESSQDSDTFNMVCSIVWDQLFGPVVNPCRRPFDFTVLFEEAILSILPGGLFSVLAAVNILRKWNQESLCSKEKIFLAKLVRYLSVTAS